MPTSIGDWLGILWAAFIIGVLGATAILVLLQLRRKHYIYFRVIDAVSKKPRSNLRVYGVRPRFKGRKYLGTTDAKGEFQLRVGAFQYPLLMIEGKGIQMGHLPTPSVAGNTAFPEEAIDCYVEFGCLQPPGS